jgi:hypothetical protein
VIVPRASVQAILGLRWFGWTAAHSAHTLLRGTVVTYAHAPDAFPTPSSSSISSFLHPRPSPPSSEAVASLVAAFDSWEVLQNERQMAACCMLQADIYARLDDKEKAADLRTCPPGV